MKILEHDLEIRRRLLIAIEQAEQTPDPRAHRFLQSVAIVSAEPTGCEVAGAVAEPVRHAMERDFDQLDPSMNRILLVDPGERVLRAMHSSLSAAAAQQLEGMGVELRLGARVQAMEPGHLTLFSGEGTGTFRQPR